MKKSSLILPLVFVILAILNAGLAYGHGMSHAGPNGGEIRMPGIFHTEVFLDQSKTVRAYLLDGDIKNAVVAKSKVSAYVKRDTQKIEMSCEVKSDYFGCKGVDLKPGDKLVIQADRQGQAGVAIYQFPFKYTGNQGLASVSK